MARAHKVLHGVVHGVRVGVRIAADTIDLHTLLRHQRTLQDVAHGGHVEDGGVELAGSSMHGTFVLAETEYFERRQNFKKTNVERLPELTLADAIRSVEVSTDIWLLRDGTDDLGHCQKKRRQVIHLVDALHLDGGRDLVPRHLAQLLQAAARHRQLPRPVHRDAAVQHVARELHGALHEASGALRDEVQQRHAHAAGRNVLHERLDLGVRRLLHRQRLRAPACAEHVLGVAVVVLRRARDEEEHAAVFAIPLRHRAQEHGGVVVQELAVADDDGAAEARVEGLVEQLDAELEGEVVLRAGERVACLAADGLDVVVGLRAEPEH
eukprot:PhM_4_TR3048/c0_g1_i11/m.45216